MVKAKQIKIVKYSKDKRVKFVIERNDINEWIVSRYDRVSLNKRFDYNYYGSFSAGTNEFSLKECKNFVHSAISQLNK